MRLTSSNVGNTPFEKRLGHNPAILKSWEALEKAFFSKTSLGDAILEQVRRALAFENECLYCQLKAGRPVVDVSDKKLRAAIDFAQKFARNPKSIGDEDFRELARYFSETEMAEFCPFVCFISACQQLGRMYQLGENEQAN